MSNVPAIATPTEIGPAASKLSPIEQRFVYGLVFVVPPGVGANQAAAVLAGYSFPSEKKLKDHAAKLARDPRVIAAVEEMARQRLTLDVPQALDTLRQAMNDKFGKDRVKAAQILLDRVLPTKQEIKVEVEQKDQTQVTLDFLQHMLDIGTPTETLLKEFGPGGLETYSRMLKERAAAKAKIIDGEVIEPEPAVTLQNEPTPPVDDDDLGDIL